MATDTNSAISWSEQECIAAGGLVGFVRATSSANGGCSPFFRVQRARAIIRSAVRDRDSPLRLAVAYELALRPPLAVGSDDLFGS